VKLFSRIGAALDTFRRGLTTHAFLNGNDLDQQPSGVNRPFEQSVWVQRAIKEISGPISAVELKFYQGDTEITAAPWLAFWQKPLANLTQADFVEALTGWLKLSGEAFIILPEQFAGKFPEVMAGWPALKLARPDSMKAIKDDADQLIAWEYRSAKGKRIQFPLEQVIQPRYWNPYDDLRGMSEYEAARVATEGDYLSGKFALNMARANGDTGVVLTMKEGSALTDVQQQQVRDQLRAKQAKSRRGEFASMFVPADLEIQDPKVRAPDASFTAQRLQNRHEIYIAFGVPPSMADVVASYSVGSASDWYRLITGTCIPTAAKIADAISQIASRMHGSPVEAYFEFDDHPVMQQVRRERIDAWTKLVDRGMPGLMAGETLDLDLPEYPAGKVGLIPFSLAPFGETPEPTQDETLAEPETESDPIQEALRALRSRSAAVSKTSRSNSDCNCGSLDFEALQLRASDSADVKRWKSIVAKRRETIRNYQSKFTAVLMTARREVLGKLQREEMKALGAASVPASRAVAADFIFDLSSFQKVFQAQMRSAGLNALQSAGEQLFAEVGKDDPWQTPQKEAVDFIRNRENRLSGVPLDVHARIKEALASGLNNGDSLRDIAKAVRAEFNEISEQRAQVIASTETAAAYGTGRDLAMRAAGIQFKQWLTSGNSNVRAAHALMNGATVGIEELFTVINPQSGEVDTVKHPADPNGAPWNVINCHCVEIAVEAPPEPTV
jgi:HK97 family phage portal protein